MPRRPRARVLWLASVALFAGAGAALGAAVDVVENPWHACAAAIAVAERAKGIPRHLLSAIALAESSKWDPNRKAVLPWPWTVTAEGQGRFFATKAEAMAAVRSVLAKGTGNIDVGCMQVNLRHHPNAFASLEEAFDPLANVAYGAGYLKALFAETGSWPLAAGRYHSATPELNLPYRSKVLRLWNEQWQAELGLRGTDAPKGLTAGSIDPRTIARWRLASLGDPGSEVRTLSDGAPPPPAKAPIGVAVLRGRSQEESSETKAEMAPGDRRGRLLEPWRQRKAGGQGSTSVTVLRGSSGQTYGADRR